MPDPDTIRDMDVAVLAGLIREREAKRNAIAARSDDRNRLKVETEAKLKAMADADEADRTARDRADREVRKRRQVLGLKADGGLAEIGVLKAHGYDPLGNEEAATDAD